jgi:hypothetical protein
MFKVSDCFTSRSRFFHLHGDVTITGGGQQNLGLCLALRALEQGGNFILPHLLWHGASVFPDSSEGPPHSIASYDTQRDIEDLFWPVSIRVLMKEKKKRMKEKKDMLVIRKNIKVHSSVTVKLQWTNSQEWYMIRSWTSCTKDFKIIW